MKDFQRFRQDINSKLGDEAGDDAAFRSSHPELKSRHSRNNKQLGRNRREKRRIGKQIKKARRIAHATKQSVNQSSHLTTLYKKIAKSRGRKVDFSQISETTFNEKQPKSKENSKKKKVSFEDEDQENYSDEEFSDSEKPRKQMKLSKKVQEMQRQIEEDDSEIIKYAKKLKLNKRRNPKSLPKSFDEDGLGYLLEICDSDKRQQLLELEDSDSEADENESLPSTSKISDNENDDDEDEKPEELPVTKKKRKLKADKNEDENLKPKIERKRVKFADVLSDNVENLDDFVQEDGENENELKEDIYGRLVDKKGNIIKTDEKRADLGAVDDKTSQMLKKNFRSIVNRLSEANILASSTKISELYGTNSRTVVKACLTEALFDSLLRPEKVPNRLVLEHCLLLAIAHTRISSEISAFFVEELCLKLQIFENDLSTNEIEEMDKKMDNVSLVLSYLGLFKVVQSKLIFEVLNLFSSKLNEKSVELILLVLQTIGSFLRKENPLELKHFIEEVNSKSSNIKDENLINRSRLQFMLDTLQLIKNNNFLKVANCDLELNERFVKLLRSFFPGKQLESPLPMTLRDLWSAKVKGRWWIVGAAVTITRPEAEEKSDRTESSESKSTKFSEKLLKLAKKHHMNTDLRRNIFCIVVSSEDYLDAFEKLCRLSLKGQQEREIIHIILTCCLIEKSYNPFYAYLLQRFCQDQPRFLLTAQFAFWDKIKLIPSSTRPAVENLARCLAHLLANKSVPLTILKVVDFGSMEKSSAKFCTILFDDFLKNVTDENLKQIFANCLSSKQHEGKYEHLVDGIRTFFNHFFVKSLEKRQAKNVPALKKKIEVLDHYLYYQLGSSLL